VESLVTAKSIHKGAVEAVGDTPFVLVINKSDLRDRWQITSPELEKPEAEGWKIKITSAKSGDGVEEMFMMLTEEVLRQEPMSDAAGEF
jgi:GTPase SAR1 family protein